MKPSYTVDPGSPADVDIRGEGTIAAAAAAGSLYGVAKRATLHSVKVFRDDVLDYTAPRQDVLDGLSWVVVWWHLVEFLLDLASMHMLHVPMGESLM